MHYAIDKTTHAVYATITAVQTFEMSELPLQQRSRLEEAKVERRAEDEQYLVQHPEVGTAIRLISRVRNITASTRVFNNILRRHCYSSDQQKPLTEFLN